jgi:tRNA U34 5-methylaminomethyl-2-thiouridine-forming methyltransferase MnmC
MWLCTSNFAAMHRELLHTADGSNTVSIPSMNVTYRSRHGAFQESRLVFIEAGLEYCWAQGSAEPLRVFEVGFGTGLNALLTAREAGTRKKQVIYTAIEPYPLETLITEALNYNDPPGIFNLLHLTAAGRTIQVNDSFRFTRYELSLAAFETTERFDLVYFDAFGPLTQPEMWSADTFSRVFSMMDPGGVLVTYCSKSVVRHTMRDVGFNVTKVPGPRGKREMVRAMKP